MEETEGTGHHRSELLGSASLRILSHVPYERVTQEFQLALLPAPIWACGPENLTNTTLRVITCYVLLRRAL